MKMTFEVTYIDGRKVAAVAMPRDFVAFERQYGKSLAAFKENPLLEWLFYLAWSPLHRTRQDTNDFDTFLDNVEDVDMVADDTPEAVAAIAGPFQTDQSPESSAP